MSKHILVGGGTGFIGRYLTQHLNKHGYDTTVVSRMPGPNRMTWLDLEKSGIPKNVSAVVNLTGQNVLDPTRRWTDGFKQNVWNSRVNSSAAFVNAIQAAPNVSSFVNISGVSHYRPDVTKVYNEADQVEGFDFMSKLCIEWEKAATLPENVATRCRGIKLRSGVVVGKGGGMVQSIYIPFKLGLGGPIGSGNQIMPWIHLDDLCNLIRQSIEDEKYNGILNGVAPEIITNGGFSKTFASSLNRPCVFCTPEFVAKLVFGEDRSVLLLSGAKIEPKTPLENGFKYNYPTAKAACVEVANS